MFKTNNLIKTIFKILKPTNTIKNYKLLDNTKRIVN
jgi:hypothetical protein